MLTRTAIACLVAVSLAIGCANPNPGRVVVGCAMDAVSDPTVIQAVMAALAAPDFRTALAALMVPAGRITAEVVACVLQSLMSGNTKLGAPPLQTEQRARARAYLTERGYVVN
jgi:hypothetical protein